MKQLLSEAELRAGVDRVASEITVRFGQKPITVVAVMTGSLVMLADLIRRLNMPIRVSLIRASSYRGATQPGELTIKEDMMLDITDRDVLIVDDIFDTGRTLTAVVQCVRSMAPRSIATAVLLHKAGCQCVDMQPDFAAFHIPDEFVVGYGLDYKDLYRNLPFLAILEQSDITASNR